MVTLQRLFRIPWVVLWVATCVLVKVWARVLVLSAVYWLVVALQVATVSVIAIEWLWQCFLSTPGTAQSGAKTSSEVEGVVGHQALPEPGHSFKCMKNALYAPTHTTLRAHGVRHRARGSPIPACASPTKPVNNSAAVQVQVPPNPWSLSLNKPNLLYISSPLEVLKAGLDLARLLLVSGQPRKPVDTGSQHKPAGTKAFSARLMPEPARHPLSAPASSIALLPGRLSPQPADVAARIEFAASTAAGLDSPRKLSPQSSFGASSPPPRAHAHRGSIGVPASPPRLLVQQSSFGTAEAQSPTAPAGGVVAARHISRQRPSLRLSGTRLCAVGFASDEEEGSGARTADISRQSGSPLSLVVQEPVALNSAPVASAVSDARNSTTSGAEDSALELAATGSCISFTMLCNPVAAVRVSSVSASDGLLSAPTFNDEAWTTAGNGPASSSPATNSVTLPRLSLDNLNGPAAPPPSPHTKPNSPPRSPLPVQSAPRTSWPASVPSQLGENAGAQLDVVADDITEPMPEAPNSPVLALAAEAAGASPSVPAANASAISMTAIASPWWEHCGGAVPGNSPSSLQTSSQPAFPAGESLPSHGSMLAGIMGVDEAAMSPSRRLTTSMSDKDSSPSLPVPSLSLMPTGTGRLSPSRMSLMPADLLRRTAGGGVKPKPPPRQILLPAGRAGTASLAALLPRSGISSGTATASPSGSEAGSRPGTPRGAAAAAAPSGAQPSAARVSAARVPRTSAPLSDNRGSWGDSLGGSLAPAPWSISGGSAGDGPALPVTKTAVAAPRYLRSTAASKAKSQPGK